MTQIERSSAAYQAAALNFSTLVRAANILGDLDSRVIGIDPALAQVMLDSNAGNRKIRPQKLDQYKRDLVEGRWKTNGEGLIVAKDGTMNDGQHRLRAILETGVSARMVVTFGVEKDTMDTVDIGSARSAGDSLHFSGVPNGQTVASMLKMVVAHERTITDGVAPAGTMIIGNVGRVTIPEITARWNDSAGRDRALIETASSYATSHNKELRGMLTPQVVAFSYWLLGRIDETAVRALLDKVRSQLGFTDMDPEYLLYKHLKRMGSRATLTNRVEAVVRAWNLIQRNKKVHRYALQDIIPLPKR